MLRKFPIRIMQFSIRSYCDGTNSRESIIQKRTREELAKDKQALKWRKSNEEAGCVDTKLKVFANDDQNSDFIVFMQKPISLNPNDWKESWEKRQEIKERCMQQFIPERHEVLGANLATAHFILYRGGAVKFLNSPYWMKADENREFPLPIKYQPQFKIEALKCDNMILYYEGLENIRWLQDLKFLSFRNVKTFDDWCLDRISGSQCYRLEILDISGTNITHRGLSCIYRMNNLKLLIVDDPRASLEFELSCSMLEEVLPKLKITDTQSVHNYDT